MLTFNLLLDIDTVDLDAEEWSSDINNVASVLKQWLRELPDPLLTHSLHQGFIEASSMYFVLATLFWIYSLNTNAVQ